MVQYTGKQSILDAALGEFRDYGFKLIEPDDHFTELWFQKKLLAVFNQTKVTIPIIRESCRNYLTNTLGDS